MRVAQVFLTMPVGGAEDLAAQAARALAPCGVETVFVCLRESGLVGAELRAQGAAVHTLPVATTRHFSHRGMRSLAEFFRRERIAVAHSHTYHAHTYAVPAARAAGCRVVVHHHKTLEKMKWHRWWTMRFLLRKADRVLALSARTAADLQRTFRLPAERVQALPNAVDSSLFHPVTREEKDRLRAQFGLPSSGHLMMTVASLHAVKNHRLGLHALQELSQAMAKRATWILVGEGAERAALEAERDRLGLAGQAILVGNQRPIGPWLQAADGFLFPSSWEGQSLALLQARACGLPILASAIEGNTALLGPEHPGLFAPDDPRRCAELWRRVMQEPAWADALVQRQNALPLPTWERLVQDLRDIYTGLLPAQSGKNGLGRSRKGRRP